jgi:hypothetical protein
MSTILHKLVYPPLLLISTTLVRFLTKMRMVMLLVGTHTMAGLVRSARR